MLPLRLLVPLLGAAIVLGACAGGSISTAPVAPVTTNSGTGTAASNAQIAIPPAGLLSAGTITLPVVSSGAGASLSVKTLVGASATQSVSRRGADSIANPSAFAEVTLTANGAVTFTGSFVASITYFAGPSTYFTAFQDQNGTVTASSALTSSGSVYTATSPSGTYTLAAGQSVSFDFSTAAATASQGGLVFGATTLSFTTTGAAAAQTDTVSETGFSGTFTATSENAAIATASLSGGTITVTPVGAGTTSIDVTGGATGKIGITVTTSPVTVN